MKEGKPSYTAREMCEYLKRPDVARHDNMLLVKLRFFEEMGGAQGKTCEVENKYMCPYGEESAHLIEDGTLVKSLWHYIEWYDCHWNPTPNMTPSEREMRWYHYGESGIIDVTSHEDIIRALEDGRLGKIIEEYEKYMKEAGRETEKTEGGSQGGQAT